MSLITLINVWFWLDRRQSKQAVSFLFSIFIKFCILSTNSEECRKANIYLAIYEISPNIIQSISKYLIPFTNTIVYIIDFKDFITHPWFVRLTKLIPLISLHNTEGKDDDGKAQCGWYSGLSLLDWEPREKCTDDRHLVQMA